MTLGPPKIGEVAVVMTKSYVLVVGNSKVRLVPLNSIDEPASLAKSQLTVSARQNPTRRQASEKGWRPSRQSSFYRQTHAASFELKNGRVILSCVPMQSHPCGNGDI